MPAVTQRVAEWYQPYLLDDLVQPHTLGRSFYMKPATKEKKPDREYGSNAEFWREVIEERIGAERIVHLRDFNLFDWVPRNPGLFHTHTAAFAREMAEHQVRSIDTTEFNRDLGIGGVTTDVATFRAATSANTRARTLIYTPEGKFSMLRGGIGCVRFKPLELRSGGTAWLMSATSTYAPDEGIPLFVGNDDYLMLSDELNNSGLVRCDVIGRTKFVADQFRDLYSVQNGIPRLYIDVSELRRGPSSDQSGEVSVAASFLSAYEGVPRIYASYVTFDPGKRGAKSNAAQWLKEEYVERLYQGSLLTDFDQRAPTFSDALFTLDQVLTSPDLAERVSKLAKLYGHFDWAQLNQFSYIEHQGDLIVTNNTITVSHSTNVVIQNDIQGAIVTVGTMPTGNDTQKHELQSLLEQLLAALPNAPLGQTEQAKALASQAKGLADEAAKQQPNKTLLQVFGQGLKQTADFLKDAVPSAVTIAGQIASLIGKIHGVPL